MIRADLVGDLATWLAERDVRVHPEAILEAFASDGRGARAVELVDDIADAMATIRRAAECLPPSPSWPRRHEADPSGNRRMLIDGRGHSLAGYCTTCGRVVDNHDAGHRVSSIRMGGRGVECVTRGDITIGDAQPLGRLFPFTTQKGSP